MPQPWIAEVNVTEELARSLIGSQFPSLADAQIELFGEGWDNTAYLVDGNTIFRFPRREMAGPLIQSECRLLPLLSPALPISVPVPEYIGYPTDYYPYQFAGYQRLNGISACDAALTDAERSALAEPLARFLRALHSFPAAKAIAHGATGDTIGRIDPGKRVPLAKGLLNRYRKELAVDTSRLDAILDAAPLDYRRRVDTVVHGDLYCRHLLIDENRQFSGIIDWGDCHVGDRAIDMLPVYTILTPAARCDFFDVYGPIDRLTAVVARARSLYHTLNVLNYARDIQNDCLEREAMVGIRHLAE